VFLIVPLLLVIGVSCAIFFQFITKYIEKTKMFITIILLCISYVFIKDNALVFGNRVNSYWIGQPQLLSPAVKVEKSLLEDARQIIKLLPEGNTLSTVRYTYVLSMLSGKYPQYYSNPYSSVPLFGKISNHQDDATLRMNAIQYIFGNVNTKSDFIRLLHSNVQNLVVDTWTNEKMDIYDIAMANGFYELEKSVNYVLYTKKVMK
jgi:hypothetical protein